LVLYVLVQSTDDAQGRLSQVADCTIEYVTSRQLMPSAARRLRASGTVLDIGPGIRPQNVVASRHHVCCEPYDEYAKLLTLSPDLLVLQASWQDAVALFPPQSVDSVVLVDVIEHLERQTGFDPLDRTVAIARHQVAVFTPLGFMPQEHPDGRDAWGLGGGDWQRHRSGWEPRDFAGWSIIACEDFHKTDVHGTALEPPGGAFWAILSKDRQPPDPVLDARQLGLRLRWTLETTPFRSLGRMVFPDRLFHPGRPAC
jgi:hypothetical protein